MSTIGQEIPISEIKFENKKILYTMTGWERTGRILLGHVQSSEKLNPEMGIDHVVNIVSVGRHGRRLAQLTPELDTIFAEDVTGNPNLPSVSRLDHDMVISSSFL